MPVARPPLSLAACFYPPLFLSLSHSLHHNVLASRSTVRQLTVFTNAFNVPGQSVTGSRLRRSPFDLEPALHRRLIELRQERSGCDGVVRKRRWRGIRWGWVAHRSSRRGSAGSWIEIWVYQWVDPSFDARVPLFYVHGTHVGVE